MEQPALSDKWDKTFAKSDKVDQKKVAFYNRFGITLAADMYTPKNAQGRLAAIAVCGPFGAVKEQASGLYAQEMAERGFITIAFDPSFTGESGGWTAIGTMSLLNTKLLAYADEIRSAVMVIHGDKAHSYYFGKDAFALLKGGNKHFVSIHGAVHTDLYDRKDIIPFDKMADFFNKYLV